MNFLDADCTAKFSHGFHRLTPPTTTFEGRQICFIAEHAEEKFSPRRTRRHKGRLATDFTDFTATKALRYKEESASFGVLGKLCSESKLSPQRLTFEHCGLATTASL